ncbi:MAG: lysoplasmalogenase [Deltaproteobacteria bacterium]|nr:lysoplasmalogenase [Deltaproteobacteria bacterium]
MRHILIVVPAAILLTGLLYFENSENLKGILPTKTLLSSLFVVTILIHPHLIPRYYQFLLVGLIFCLGGDICLAIPGKKWFLAGLVSFLLGHLFYIFGFFHIADPGTLSWVGTVIVFIVSSGIYFWLKPHLGSMNIPVLFYVVVITVMMSAAWSVFVDSDFAVPGRVMVFSGALLFYLSDLFVARDRFVKKEFFNRLLGLPLYFAGQFTLAFSAGVLQ